MAHPAAPALPITGTDRAALVAIIRAPTSEQRAVLRARIVLRCGDGAPIERIAGEVLELARAFPIPGAPA